MFTQREKNLFGVVIGLILAFVLCQILAYSSNAQAGILEDAAVVMHGNGKQGSGLVVSPGLIMTAKHVAVSVNEVSQDGGKTWSPATTVWVHPLTDLAIMYAPLVKCPCVEPAIVRLGDNPPSFPLTIIGYPQFATMHAQVTSVGNFEGMMSGYYIIGAPVGAGMSGGPAYAAVPNDGVYAVGVVYGIPTDADGHNSIEKSLITPFDGTALNALVELEEKLVKGAETF